MSAKYVVAGRKHDRALFVALEPLTVGGPDGKVRALKTGEALTAAEAAHSGGALQRLVHGGKIAELHADHGVAAAFLDGAA